MVTVAVLVVLLATVEACEILIAHSVRELRTIIPLLFLALKEALWLMSMLVHALDLESTRCRDGDKIERSVLAC